MTSTQTSVAATQIRPGDFISWDTWCGPTTVQVWRTDDFSVSYQAADGCLDAFRASCSRTLGEQLGRVRSATPAEVEAFRSIARPWRPVD